MISTFWKSLKKTKQSGFLYKSFGKPNLYIMNHIDVICILSNDKILSRISCH